MGRITCISHEVELEVIAGPDPLYAMQLLHSFGLLPCILVPSPQALGSNNIEGLPWDRYVKGVASLEALLSSDSDTLPVHQILRDATLSDKSLRARLTLAAAMNPFRGMSYTVKKKQVPLVDSVIRDGLKVYVISLLIGL